MGLLWDQYGIPLDLRCRSNPTSNVLGLHFSAFDPRLSAISLALGIYVAFPRPFLLTMASDIGDGTPLLPTVVTGNLTPTPDTTMTTKVNTNNAPKQYPIRFNIRIKNRETNVNPFAAIKSFLTELTTHDPTAKLGDHSEIFYSSTDFPSTEKDFNDAFHGKVADHENQKFKPFFHESVGNGLSVYTWCYLHTTF